MQNLIFEEVVLTHCTISFYLKNMGSSMIIIIFMICGVYLKYQGNMF